MSFEFTTIFRRIVGLVGGLAVFLFGIMEVTADVQISAPIWGGEVSSHIVLDGSDSRYQLLVTHIQPEVLLEDKTRSVQLTAEPKGLVRINNGLVEPISNGKGKIYVGDTFGNGAAISETFTIEIVTRTFEVEWVTEEISFNWNDYLEQGNQWEDSISPGKEGRVIDFIATLELEQELGPQDNFTLSLLIENDNYKKTVQTEGGNITANETAKAIMERDSINPAGENGIYTADSEEELFNRLLGQAGSRTAQGVWTWTVFAQQADPDSLIETLPDPDPGNDWDLEVIVTIMRPELTEITFG
mgnify:CR=1 FL=1